MLEEQRRCVLCCDEVETGGWVCCALVLRFFSFGVCVGFFFRLVCFGCVWEMEDGK